MVFKPKMYDQKLEKKYFYLPQICRSDKKYLSKLNTIDNVSKSSITKI